ncbi:FAD binding domain-containing protein [Trichoderma breve]|uniref:FAD binding domain-containing protein n=1 Tax=Trichoderma breve TaxID=2034170 RepID=A0A9W9B2P1_9HYPO|nr:FAD binding domain-containing protein [Trichoderma breve]KAJ4854147.1 FAD binding domain-containing protein [Trichoderma breve]
MSSTTHLANPLTVLSTDVLIVGGGPVRLFTAYQLGMLGVNTILVERNHFTTKFPKMDLTHERTMEIYRKVGLASLLRSSGVPMTHGFNEIYATGLGRDSHHMAQIYVIGCDGAGSRIRGAVGIETQKEGMPLNMLLIHFISNDTAKISKHGQFWHLYIGNGAVVINQDGKNTFTMQIPVTTDNDLKEGDNVEEFINRKLGGWGQPSDVKVDEVCVISRWEAAVALADSFRSVNGRVFLCGDSAHRLTPAGGHGLNSGINVVFNLTWKLAANVHGWGGEALLASYSKERRSAAELNIDMVRKAMAEIVIPRFGSISKDEQEKLVADSEEGREARRLMAEKFMLGDWLHKQLGITLGHRYRDTPVIINDTSSAEPRQSDLCGPSFTIVDFTTSGEQSDKFSATAEELQIPLKKVHLPDETHCRMIWERDVVLVRPDLFVAWRSSSYEVAEEKINIKDILLKVVGKA